MKYFIYFISFFLFACNSTDNVIAQEIEKKALVELKKEIVALVDSSICSSEFNCNFIGLGSKPCGGHWQYLLYSNSIDTDDLLSKIEKYNALENKFNEKWGIMSDCSMLLPPDYVICEDGKCKAVYNN
jgi:hypothetical protein